MNGSHHAPGEHRQHGERRCPTLEVTWGWPLPSMFRKSSAFRHALYLWEPRLPAMGREAAPVTDVRYGSKAAIQLVSRFSIG
ncbi:protein of unknown function [Pseudomonas sp. JV551A1]|nr:protein of unknown function [Pseudomonas sp. JV551A1]